MNQVKSTLNSLKAKANDLKKKVSCGMKKAAASVKKTISKKLKKANITYTGGFNISGALGPFTIDISIGISIDTKGNVAIQYSKGGGVAASAPTIAISKFSTITNAKNVYALEGKSVNAGGSVGVYGAYGGIDYNVGGAIDEKRNEDENKYVGLTKYQGIGIPGGEVHVEWMYTDTIYSFNSLK